MTTFKLNIWVFAASRHALSLDFGMFFFLFHDSPFFYFVPGFSAVWILSIKAALILVTAVPFLPERLELVSSNELAESWLEYETSRGFLPRFCFKFVESPIGLAPRPFNSPPSCRSSSGLCRFPHPCNSILRRRLVSAWSNCYRLRLLPPLGVSCLSPGVRPRVTLLRFGRLYFRRQW